MMNVAMFLGVCIAIYAVFSYMQTRIFKEMNKEIISEVLGLYGDDIIPIIVEIVSRDITTICLNEFDSLAKIGFFGFMEEVTRERSKKEITEARTKDYKKFTGDKGGS